MDYTPIFILCLLAAYYFWKQVSGSIVIGIFGILIPFAIIRIIWFFPILSIAPKIGLSYSILALCLLVPAFLCVRKAKWQGVKFIFLALISFIIAIVCRSIDKGIGANFPMGTHFLWHIFGGISAFCMLKFCAQVEENKVK
jgi:hemolysin III